jgi:hyperosmotically inducible periplasmic protein
VEIFHPPTPAKLKFVMQVLNRISLSLVLLAAPLGLFAAVSLDGKIEEAARQSYNFRAVLDNEVTARAHQGHVTLTGSVDDSDAKSLAQDTVENLPGVTGVTNNISIAARHTVRSDSWMALKIRSHLLVKANVSATTTTVSVKDGIATLGGTAANLAQKELTGLYAGEIDSVKSVNNNIVVQDVVTLSEKIDDASITTQVKFALLSHKSTSALKTKVTTVDGVVRVTGEAASAAEKSLVTKLAQDVRGTASVTNDMSVKG